MLVRYSHRVERCETLGPGVRAVLWVHGCCFDCPGCIAQNYRNGPYTEESPESLACWYLSIEGAQGLTISGGEPMLQAAALARTLDIISGVRSLNVVVYTGFEWEALQKRAEADEGVRRLLRRTDILIDGPYVQALDDGAPYIGSSNQRLRVLNPALKDEADAYYHGAQGRRVELRIARDATYLVGVPSADQRKIWEKIKKLGEKST